MLSLASVLLFGYLLVLAGASAPRGAWDVFNYAPHSRTVRPTTIYKTGGSVSNAWDLLSGTDSATLSGNGSYISLDFGKEVS